MRLDDVGVSGSTPSAKVLVVSIDDGLFGVHLDWVEGVFDAGAIATHLIRVAGGRGRPFLLGQHQPAPLIDVRELLGLVELLGSARRPGQLLLRCADGAVALPIDACLGIRALVLDRRAPVPTRVLRDGGLPLGHLSELDGRPLTVLDPNRLLDADLRAALAPLWTKARALHERLRRVSALWEELRREATAERVRAYARLCSRTGQGRTAGAARRLLGYMEAADRAGGAASAPAECGGDALDALLRELVERERTRASGALVVEAADGAQGAIVLSDGRVVGATCGGAEGRAAFSRLLSAVPIGAHFTAHPEGRAARTGDSAIALAIAALAALPDAAAH